MNTASILGLQPTQVAPVYCVCKHGIVSLGRALAGDEFYKKYKVRVVTMCPGLTLSGLHSAPVAVRSVFPHKISEEMRKKGVKMQEWVGKKCQ